MTSAGIDFAYLVAINHFDRGFSMNFAGMSFFRMMCAAPRPGGFGRHVGMILSLLAALIAVPMVEVGWCALLGLLGGAILSGLGQRSLKLSARGLDNAGTSDGSEVGLPGFYPPEPGPVNSIVGRVQAHRPHRRKTQLIKAGVLWHRHGDRHGARGHCHDLLSRTRPEDPLFAEICDLYLCTCRTPPSRAVGPAVPLPAGFTKAILPMPVTSGGAKIIPFKSPDVRPPSTL